MVTFHHSILVVKNMLEIFINDRQYAVSAETRLLDVCRDQQIPIPTLCYHPALPGFAGCRLCVVELRKETWSKLVTACEYPVFKAGERFYTDSDMVKQSRRMTAKLLLTRAPDAKEALERILGETIMPEFEPLQAFNKKCVLCGLCYRVCQAQGTGAIYTMGRGADKVVETPYKEANTDCIGCGSCAAVCPTGAIVMRELPGKRAIWGHLFELLPCPDCGKRHITDRMVAYIRAQSNMPEVEIRRCPECRQKNITTGMLTGLSHESRLS